MRIVFASPVAQSALHKLSSVGHEISIYDPTRGSLRDQLRDCEILVFRSDVQLTAHELATAQDLKLLIRAGSGVDNIDLDYLNERKLILERIPEPAAIAVAELVFAQMLVLSRNLCLADRLTREGYWAKQKLLGHTLTGKTLGLIGLGNIGKRIAQMATAWHMEVLGCVEHSSERRRTEMQGVGVSLMDFDSVITRSDYLSVQVPLTENTHHMISTEVLTRVKPGAVLINVSRGAVVDEAALYQALSSGERLRAAGLDVHYDETEGRNSALVDLPNVLLTPHIGSMTVETQEEIGQRIVSIVSRWSQM